MRSTFLTFVLGVVAVPATTPAAAQPLSVRVEGTRFVVTDADGRTTDSAGLIGRTIRLSETVQVRVDDVQRDARPSSAGQVWLHHLAVLTDGEWVNPCQPDAQGETWAFPMSGRMDTDYGNHRVDAARIFITCTGGAFAKCVRAGYQPWSNDVHGRDMESLYQACVRMIRADYCGDGTSTTRDGTLIDIYDDSHIQTSDNIPDFRFEAGWTPDGAVCVNHVRIPELTDLQALAVRCPRLANLLGQSCTQDQARRRGAVLFNSSR